MGAYKEYLLNVWETRFERLEDRYSLEDRNLLFARFGMIIAAVMIILMGVSEMIFLCSFLWYLVR
jgi:hypothetical protein